MNVVETSCNASENSSSSSLCSRRRLRREIERNAERLHGADVAAVGGEGELPGAFAFAERSFEGESAGFAAHLELHRRHGRRVDLRPRQRREIVDAHGRAHVVVHAAGDVHVHLVGTLGIGGRGPGAVEIGVSRGRQQRQCEQTHRERERQFALHESSSGIRSDG
jgi:hypothetical protein